MCESQTFGFELSQCVDAKQAQSGPDTYNSTCVGVEVSLHLFPMRNDRLQSIHGATEVSW